MAIYHSTVKVFSRSRGESSTAAAAYRAASNITDVRTGLVHNYARRKGVLDVFVHVPPGSPSWARDVSALWNAAEARETRINSCVARELEVSLPAELSPEQRAVLASSIAQTLVQAYGVAAMTALHAPSRGGDARNFHAHILMSTRVLTPAGFGAKVRLLDDRTTGPEAIMELRHAVARLINQHLQRAGFDDRVDERRLDAQARSAALRGDVEGVARLSRAPTKHVGKAGTAAVRRGGHSPRHSANAGVAAGNAARIGAARRRAQSVLLGSAPVGLGGRGRSKASAVARSAPARLGEMSLSLRATGADAKLLNDQATLLQNGLRLLKDALQAYLAGLTVPSMGSVDDLDAYAHARKWGPADAAAAVRSLRAHPEHAGVLLEAARSFDVVATARRVASERNAALSEAEFLSTEADQAVAENAHERPPMWRVKSRRQWADLRRGERRAAEAARLVVRTLDAEKNPPLAEAVARAERAEAVRRRRIPLPSDGITAKTPRAIDDHPKTRAVAPGVGTASARRARPR